jgi:signal transduction histidine kinase
VAIIDRDKLRHILENLINNAIKFTEVGSITVSARLANSASLSKAANQSRWLILDVSDTGLGIPPDSLELIFEKFCQLDTSSTRLHGGVGIGLYLVNRFVTVQGGEVSVKSQLGKGSTFTVALPYITPSSLPPQEAANLTPIPI